MGYKCAYVHAEWADTGPTGDVTPEKRCFYDAVRADIAARPLQPRKCRRYGTRLCQHWSTVGCDSNEDTVSQDAHASRRRRQSPAPLAVPTAASWTVLIVGASRGIGRDLARAYASAGASVHVTVRTLQSTSLLVAEFPAEITVHVLDVLNSAQLLALAATFDAHGTAIDLLVTVAGINKGTFELQKRVNANAPFKVIEALLPAVRRSRTRRVGVVTSDLGRTSWIAQYRKNKFRGRVKGCEEDEGICVYALSKLLTNQRFRELEPEWRRIGVTAVALQPGYVSTDMNGGKGPVSPSESAHGLRKVLSGDMTGIGGQFVDYTGKVLD